MEYQYFDLHPYEHCGKHNHPLDVQNVRKSKESLWVDNFLAMVINNQDRCSKRQKE
jgi:hypothetical protein